MRTIEKSRKNLEIKDYRLRSASESDYEELVKESAILTSEGRVKVIYQQLDDLGFDSDVIVRALKTIKYQEGRRSRGLTSYSRIFGFSPRTEFRQNFCKVTSLALDHPNEHQILCDYAKKISEIYRMRAKEVYEEHDTMALKVMGQWKLEGSPFTSGIVNKNSALKYHHDTGNFKDVYSCMLGFKYNVQGGYLALPEYNVAFEIKNNSLFIFDGQNIIHGVTPIKYLSEDAFRYTIVYYSLKRMWECKTVGEEVERIRNIHTEIEEKRARGELSPAVLAKLKRRKVKETLGSDVRG